MLITDSNELTLGNTIFGDTFKLLQNSPYVACKTREDLIGKSNFKVRLNYKTTYLLNSMGIWMYSSLSLLIILAVFTFIMISILRGKKLSLLKKDFVNNMTHELKTPIANIAVASEAIKNKNFRMDDDKLEKYANIIHNENHRLHHLVDRVLQISAIQKNDESLQFEKTDLHQIIDEVLLNFEAVLHKRDGQLKASLKATKFSFKADKTHISNVIYNLIENAIKYSGNTPEIAIETVNVKNGINIIIADQGIGMSSEVQERIFEKFYRAESGDLHNTKGYGLGLSYVKLMVEYHKGTVTFKSKPGVGSTFTIFLPL
jgi:two-component system phosphate regulon sensor histidine kinase PhoR